MEKLPHVRSPSYRTAVIDSAVCVHIAQGLLDRLLISLTRLEVITTAEEITILPGGSFQSFPGKTPESHLQKSFEFTAEMRPDQALAVVNSILETLRRIPAERKATYGIPDNVAPFPPVPIGSAS